MTKHALIKRGCDILTNDMIVCKMVYKILLVGDPTCSAWCTNLMNSGDFNKLCIYIIKMINKCSYNGKYWLMVL